MKKLTSPLIKQRFFYGYLLAHLLGYGSIPHQFPKWKSDQGPTIDRIRLRFSRILTRRMRGIAIPKELLRIFADFSVRAYEIPRPLTPLLRIIPLLMKDATARQMFIDHEQKGHALQKVFIKVFSHTKFLLKYTPFHLPPLKDVISQPMLLERNGRARVLRIQKQFLLMISPMHGRLSPDYPLQHELLHIVVGLTKVNIFQPYQRPSGPKGYEQAWPEVLAREYAVRALQYIFNQKQKNFQADLIRRRELRDGFDRFDEVVQLIQDSKSLRDGNLRPIINQLTEMFV